MKQSQTYNESRALGEVRRNLPLLAPRNSDFLAHVQDTQPYLQYVDMSSRNLIFDCTKARSGIPALVPVNRRLLRGTPRDFALRRANLFSRSLKVRQCL